jgi:hypothetical protein
VEEDFKPVRGTSVLANSGGICVTHPKLEVLRHREFFLHKLKLLWQRGFWHVNHLTDEGKRLLTCMGEDYPSRFEAAVLQTREMIG